MTAILLIILGAALSELVHRFPFKSKPKLRRYNPSKVTVTFNGVPLETFTGKPRGTPL